MRGGSGNRVIPLQSTRFCSYVQFFFAAPFVSLSFFLGLCFFSFSVRFRDEQEGGKAEREREKRTSNNPFGARVTHARSAFILPAFSSKPGLPTRDIYIYTIFSPVFRLCFSPYDERNATNDLLPVFFLQQKRKEFSFTYVGTYEPRELFARKHDGGVE